MPNNFVKAKFHVKFRVIASAIAKGKLSSYCWHP